MYWSIKSELLGINKYFIIGIGQLISTHTPSIDCHQLAKHVEEIKATLFSFERDSPASIQNGPENSLGGEAALP